MLGELFTRKSLIGFIVKISGVVVIAWGIIQGFIVLAEYSLEFGGIPMVVLVSFFAPTIVGLLIIGFGEVIDLLQELVDHGKPQVGLEKSSVEKDSPSILPTIPLFDEADLREFYSNKDIEIDTIKPTKRRDLFIVEANGKTDYVELGGFSPRILSEQEVKDFLE